MGDRGGFAPKTRVLTQQETQASLDTWRETLLFNLTLDGTFELFLGDNVTWKSEAEPDRGLTTDTTGDNKKTAKQKLAILNRMLGSIASYAPVISRQFIMKEATSLDAIWHRLRIYYGFRKSGGLILDLTSVSPEEGESPEAFWERLYAFMSDNLLSPSDNLTHLDVAKPPKEVMTPTLLNTTVTLWLQKIHPQLPVLVKQKFSTELRNKTLASLREEISESLSSLLAEIQGENANISRMNFRGYPKKSYSDTRQKPFYNKKQVYSSYKRCPLCEAHHRPTDHFLSECSYLPESDKKFMLKAKSRLVDVEDEEEEEFEEEEPVIEVKPRKKAVKSVNLRKVDIASSPYFTVQYGPNTVNILLDSGAEANLMELEYARQLGVTITPTSTSASLADGSSNLKIVGEVHIIFTRDGLEFKFDAIVADKLTDKVIAGIPFLTAHDIYARPSKRTIYVGTREFKYGTHQCLPQKASIMRIPRRVTLYPGESVSVGVPDSLRKEAEVAVEPRLEAPSLQRRKFSQLWLKPQIVPTEDGQIKLMNKTSEPVTISRHEQIATVRPVTSGQQGSLDSPTKPPSPDVPSTTTDYLDINLDPDNLLSSQQKHMFSCLHEEFKDVFDGRTLGCYNGASGPLEVVVNMGPTLPPQRKGKLPLYSRSQQEEMQQICDDLEGTVLLKPEEVGITCEYLNPSFLVKKKDGKKRLVTAFAEVGKYAKPQPALMSKTEESVRQIGMWRYLIHSDFKTAYWQLNLSKSSMKYCGISTPFKGVRVYGRGAMGMPGTETALEELLARILGDLIAEGSVTKVADDLYCGGRTPEEALQRWRKVVMILRKNGLRLSAAKTIICPKRVTILGWIWEEGTLRACPHKIAALAAVEPPTTVGKLRSYIGGVKFLKRVMKGYSDVLHPLEEVVGGRESSEKINWSDSLLAVFKRSQAELQNTKTLTIPRKEDQLQIVTDASGVGVGAALYVVRDRKPLIAGYFNAKHKNHQAKWLPCELEALSICAAVSNFGTDILNSDKQTMVLTDSLPCVQAYQKLCQGKFSASSRVSTFLSVLSRYNVHLMHIKGSDNIYSDYASRNALECTNKSCQICQFLEDTSESVVRACTVQEVLQSATPVPFSSRNGWYELQASDHDVRRAAAHLKQGTKPSHKEVDIPDVKRYRNIAKVARDGLLIVEHYSPSVGRTEKIVVPRDYIHGLLECLHLKLEHPKKAQLLKVFGRAFYALDLEEAIDTVLKRCHICLSLDDMPNKFLHQTSTTNPTAVGSNFSADIVKRSGQSILLMREYISSFTSAKIIPNEKAATIRSALLVLCSDIITKSGPVSVIKVDPASSCRSLVGDLELKQNGMTLELGEPKYVNKNPVAERAIREFHSEVNRLLDGTTHISEQVLAKTIANMNSRIRGEGVSSWEIWTQRSQFTGEQLPIDDLMLMRAKEEQKRKGHLPSAVFKARGKHQSRMCPIVRGDLVYINSDRNKLCRRDRYIVVDVNRESCKIQKFSGRQLRARPYMVNRSDIMTIQPWEFRGDLSEGASNQDQDDNTMVGTNVSVPINEDVTESVSESGEEDTEDSPDKDKVTRSGRRVRPPVRFADYTMCKED